MFIRVEILSLSGNSELGLLKCMVTVLALRNGGKENKRQVYENYIYSTAKETRKFVIIKLITHKVC